MSRLIETDYLALFVTMFILLQEFLFILFEYFFAVRTN
jgi:hypothetical protein